jgi:multiple sugar transport system ATP-binding protein
MATLKLTNISKSFGDLSVLQDIDLDIEDKEFIVFVGPSGCGKSTLLRIIAGLDYATEGSLCIDSVDVGNMKPVDRGIAMVFQSYALFPHMSVYENIAYPLKVNKLPAAEIKVQVEHAAEILKLTNKLSLKPSQLSGGQRQRVAIGRSIVRNPKIFLFDEPLSNLDAALRGDMRVELSQLHKKLDATMVYVTHDQVEAMTMADRVVVLNGGHVEQFGTPMELYHHPATRFVAGFIGQPNMNFIPANVEHIEANGLAVSLAGGHRMTLPVDTQSVCIGDVIEVGIRPENIVLESEGVSVFVRVLERLGSMTIMHGAIEDSEVRFCASLAGDVNIKTGNLVTFSMNPRDCHVFNQDGVALRRMSAPDLSF